MLYFQYKYDIVFGYGELKKFVQGFFHQVYFKFHYYSCILCAFTFSIFEQLDINDIYYQRYTQKSGTQIKFDLYSKIMAL